MDTLNAILRRNTRWFVNCLDGLTDAQALVRPSERNNNIAFLAAHLVDVRFFLARYIGLDVSNPYEDLLSEARGIDDLATIPPIADLRVLWLELSARVADRLRELTEEDLAQETRERFPLTAATRGDGIAFLLQHEMYHIGQMALLRKYVGQAAMAWS